MTELSFARTWLPVIYLYGAGGIIFVGGMFFIVKAKSINFNLPTDRRWFKVLIAGFLYYFGIHGFLTLAALYF